MACCPLPGPPRQRGAIALLGTFVLLLVVVCTVVALDTGRLYLERQDLQRVADLAALEASGSCQQKEARLDCAGLQGFAERNAEDNGFDLDAGELVVEAGTLAALDGRYDFQPGGSLPDAIRVTASRTVPTSLVGNLAALLPGSGVETQTTLSADAVARQKGGAALSAGSSLLTANLDDSPLLRPLLQELLGSAVELSVLSFSGLTDASVSLLSLIEASPRAGSLEALLDTPIGVGGEDGLVALMLSALEAEQDEALSLEIENALTALLAVELGDITLNEILDVATPSADRAAALETDLSVGELLNAALLLANSDRAPDGPNAIRLDELSVSLGREVAVDLLLEIIEPPQIAVGPVGCATSQAPPCTAKGSSGEYWYSQASSGQLALELSLDVELLGLASLTLDLDLQGVNGIAGIETVEPVGGGDFDARVAAMTSPLELSVTSDLRLLPDFDGLLTLSLSGDSERSETLAGMAHVSERVIWPDPGGTRLSSGLVGLTGTLDALLSDLQPSLQLGPDAETDEECSGLLSCLVGGVADLLSPVLDVVNDLLEITVDSLSELTGALTSVLSGLTHELIDPLVMPLLEALGLSVAEVEVEILDIQTQGVELVL